MKVQNFSYNGFSGKLLDGFAPYTAEFIKWTSDPGIIECKCSDDKTRLIPSFALHNVILSDFPIQKKTGVLFGMPSHS